MAEQGKQPTIEELQAQLVELQEKQKENALYAKEFINLCEVVRKKYKQKLEPSPYGNMIPRMIRGFILVQLRLKVVSTQPHVYTME